LVLKVFLNASLSFFSFNSFIFNPKNSLTLAVKFFKSAEQCVSFFLPNFGFFSLILHSFFTAAAAKDKFPNYGKVYVLSVVIERLLRTVLNESNA